MINRGSHARPTLLQGSAASNDAATPTTSEQQSSSIAGIGGQPQRAVGYFCGRLRRTWVWLRLRHYDDGEASTRTAGINGADHGAHLFSHSLPDLLRSGASFAAIGQLLCHLSIGCTRIRAKLDIEKLRQPSLAGRCPLRL